jgi:hypothetical protein
LIAGYHLAFAIGAASVAVGILTALALLRPRRSPQIEPMPLAQARPVPLDHAQQAQRRAA